ncbi:hypothetical protein PILCRDRAFT_505755 [Piloderma croceum F 1598]|uniref:Uncharacterized protein n=1 Tax=Piloderma croceum (strain F 1598) TaxID=765440 RepID=A0A0C3FNE0_PILCF|nr:hypothetical protein PILCRDRAFT_505755 [Piloderma croceum F 1598]
MAYHLLRHASSSSLFLPLYRNQFLCDSVVASVRMISLLCSSGGMVILPSDDPAGPVLITPNDFPSRSIGVQLGQPGDAVRQYFRLSLQVTAFEARPCSFISYPSSPSTCPIRRSMVTFVSASTKLNYEISRHLSTEGLHTSLDRGSW